MFSMDGDVELYVFYGWEMCTGNIARWACQSLPSFFVLLNMAWHVPKGRNKSISCTNAYCNSNEHALQTLGLDLQHLEVTETVRDSIVSSSIWNIICVVLSAHCRLMIQLCNLKTMLQAP